MNTFAEVGKDLDKATLAAIKPNESFEFGTDYIQFFDAQGGNAGRYTYIPESPEEGFPAGWYDYVKLQDNILDCQNEKILPFGGMIMFYALSSTSLANTYSGEVVQGAKTLKMAKGKNWVGNACPVKKTLIDFVPGDNFEFGTDYIQFFDPQGGNAGRYTYIPESPEEGFPAGWYDYVKLQDNVLDCQNEKNVDPGTGFMFYNLSASAGIDLTVPSAL